MGTAIERLILARLVIDLGTTMRILEDGIVWSKAHAGFAETLLRSQVLDDFFRRMREGQLAENVALAPTRRSPG